MNAEKQKTDFEKLKSETGDNLRKLQKKTLEMYQYFAKICKEYGLFHCVIGGAVIGAVVYQGFVPWDDDIDIFMSREDYVKLPIIWERYADVKRYPIYYPKPDFFDYQGFISIRDSQTTFIKKTQKNLDIIHGAAVEIAPWDGCPKSKLAQASQMFWALIFGLFYTRIEVLEHGCFLKFFTRIIKKFVHRE